MMTDLIGFEIFANPEDLVFRVERLDGSDKYSVMITRGPGDKFKLLLAYNAVFPKDGAIGAIEQILKASREVGLKVSKRFGIDVAKCLTEAEQNKILADLGKTGESITHS